MILAGGDGKGDRRRRRFFAVDGEVEEGAAAVVLAAEPLLVVARTLMEGMAAVVAFPSPLNGGAEAEGSPALASGAPAALLADDRRLFDLRHDFSFCVCLSS
mmetsp:Transcript_33268/g.80472  ORF Transcript_33268/g.80472 Transcript_33268/m.80472 type:complete len:102 (-) Transcript_33268:8-313(-)